MIVNVSIYLVDIEKIVVLFLQFLHRKKMFEYNATRLENCVKKALLFISRLDHTKAIWIAKAIIEPAANQNFCQKVDQISL